jgi:hypothetical protein
MPSTGKDQQNHNGNSPGIDGSVRSAITTGRNARSATSITEPGNVPDQEEHGSNSPVIMNGARIISYNIGEGERPGGMKVRFKIRVETGKKAAALNAQQAEAIKELLEWARQHRKHP